jgi:hypothetical protein
MPVKQGSLELLQHPASKELLQSTIPARLAYVWTDGSPRGGAVGALPDSIRSPEKVV